MLPATANPDDGRLLVVISTKLDTVIDLQKDTGERLRTMEISYSATCQQVGENTKDIIALDKKVDDRKTIDNWWSGINSLGMLIAGILGIKSP